MRRNRRRNEFNILLAKTLVGFMAMLVLSAIWNTIMSKYHLNSTAVGGAIVMLLIPVVIYRVSKKIIIALKEDNFIQ